MPPQPSFPIHNVSVRTSRSGLSEEELQSEQLEEPTYGGPPTDIATEFINRYGSQGLQPSVGQRPVISYKKTEVTPPKNEPQQGRVLKKRLATQKELSAPTQYDLPQRRPRVSKKQLLATLDPTGSSSTVVRVATVSRVNLFILGWAVPLWLFFQIPLALLAIASLGMAVGSDALIQEVFGGFLGSIISAVSGAISSVVSWVSGSQVDLNPITAVRNFGTSLVIVLTICTFFIGVITLVAMAFLYTFSRIDCFFGHWTAAKISFFIFALVGYFFPITNLLPWFMLWGIVIWLSQLHTET